MFTDDLQLNREVRRYIVSELPVDAEVFITENALAERFEMSRSAARKLLLALEGEGALCCTAKGYRRISYKNTPANIVYNIREAVEESAVTLAVERAERRDIAELMLLIEDLDSAIADKDFNRYNQLDEEFHQAIIRSAHDPMLEKISCFLLWTAATPSAGYATEDSETDGQEKHRQLFNAIRDRNAESARKIIKEHLKGEF